MGAGKDFATAAEEVCAAGWIGQVGYRGPWFCRVGQASQQVADVFTPVPATLHRPKSAPTQDRRLIRLDPLGRRISLPGWTPPLPGMRALWPKEHIATQPLSGYLTREGLKVFLEGGVPKLSEEHLLPAECIYGYDRRTGIGVDADRYAAEEGLIYSAKFLSLQPRMGLYAEIELPPTAPADVVPNRQGLPFGGEGRRIVVQQVRAVRLADRQTAQRPRDACAANHAGPV